MAKRPNADESGDNTDLQALFDSIAETANAEDALTAAQPPKVASVAPSAAPSVVAQLGDSDDLQALFDSVATEKEAPRQVAGQESMVDIKAAVAASAHMSAAERQNHAFEKIGQLTRLLHDTIHQLGYDKLLEETAEKLPDARQRLSYISQMTEQAASRVLNATDIAKPIQDKIEVEAGELSAKWTKLYNKQLSIEEFKLLARQTHAFVTQAAVDSKVVNEQLLEIMMAQDFQDLTGQVIKKIGEMAAMLEGGLLKVLIDIMPDTKRVEAEDGLLNGPVISAVGREDVVTSQEQVDDLLDSLGF